MDRYPQRFGDYVLLERLERGGMAEIFRAKAFGVEGFQKIFALKRILPNISSDPLFVNMFIDEAKIVSTLAHDNICQIFEFGRAGDFYFQVMEFVVGLDLRRVLNHFQPRGRLLPVNFVLYLGARIAEGLDYAHRKVDAWGRPLNIVHRDISPRNVIVSYEGTVKLIDFGIAKAKERVSETVAGTVKGRLPYMSPEYLLGRPSDHRADLFSLGAVLYELLTGEAPFGNRSDYESIHRTLMEEVAPPSTRRSSIPREVDRTVLTCLSPTPENRYPSAEELRVDLDRCLLDTGELTTTTRVGDFMAYYFADYLEVERGKQEEFADVFMPPDSPDLAGGSDNVTYVREFTSDDVTAEIASDVTTAALPTRGSDDVSEVRQSASQLAHAATMAALPDDDGVVDEFCDDEHYDDWTIFDKSPASIMRSDWGDSGDHESPEQSQPGGLPAMGVQRAVPAQTSLPVFPSDPRGLPDDTCDVASSDETLAESWGPDVDDTIATPSLEDDSDQEAPQ
jgi:serine/threonine protein kinase